MKKLNNNSFHAVSFCTLIVLFFIFVFLPSVKKINTDFPNYYVSANMFLEGKNLIRAYDNIEFNKQVLLHGIENQFVSFVPYPPVNALIMLPLAKLEPLTAKLVWNIFNLFCFTFCIFFISRISGLNIYLTGILFFISGYAFVNNFFFGQIYLLILLLFSSSLFFLLKNNDIIAALLFSVSVLLKFYTVFFIILFLCRRKYKMSIASVIFILILNLIAFSITGSDVNIFYYTEILPRISDGWVGTVYAAEFQSVLSMLHTFFYYEPSLNPNPLIESSQLYFIFKYLFYFGILISSTFLVIHSDKRLLLTQVSLFCFVCMLLLPVNASYQYVILIPAIAILTDYYINEKHYKRLGILLILFFTMNSPFAVFLITVTKGKPYFFPGYIKLFILIYFWSANFIILKNHKLRDKSRSSFFRWSFAYVILVLIFTRMSLAINNEEIDDAKSIIDNPGYLLSMPNSAGNKLVYVESVSNKFVLNSNFGFKYDKENVFHPMFISNDEITYSTIAGRKDYFKKLFMSSLKDTVLNNSYNADTIQYSRDKSFTCFSKEGQIFLLDVSNNKLKQLTFGNSFNTLPVFADNDSKIIFCSDRNRGVGFTTLYEIKLNN